MEVKCPRVECPALDCDEKTAVRPDKKACCRQCPVAAVTTASTGGDLLPRDQAAGAVSGASVTPATKRTPENILSAGGCKYPMGGLYENGKEWHPRVHSHGEMKCVKCRCKVKPQLFSFSK